MRTEHGTAASELGAAPASEASLELGRALGGESELEAGLETAREARTLGRAVRAVAILSRHFERACSETGLSLPQYRLLLWVRHGPTRAAELADRAAVRRPTLTALVDGLENEGLLARAAVEGDRRGIRLSVTEKGMEAIASTERRLGKLLSGFAKGEHHDAILEHLSLLSGEIERALAEYYRRA